MMTIVCPECNTPYRLPSGLVPARKSAAKCKKCGARMIISPQMKENDIHLSQAESSVPETETQQEPRVVVSEQAETESYPEEHDPDIDDIDCESHPDTLLREHDEILSVFPELKELSTTLYSITDIFSPDKRHEYNHRTNRLKVKLLTALAPTLEAGVLLDNEYVVNVARGSAYYLWEIPYANGLFTLPTNYYAIICTNYRLVLINIDRRATKHTRYIFQVFYHEIVGLSRGIFQTSLILRIKNGRSWNFTTVGWSLSREIKNLIIRRSNECESFWTDQENQGSQLCPACFAGISGVPKSCPSCNAKFKSPAVACRRAMLFPGLGSIYLGYIPLGILEILSYVSVWAFLGGLFYLKIPMVIPAGGGIMTIFHVVAAVLSVNLGKKGVVLDQGAMKETRPDQLDINSDQLRPLI